MRGSLALVALATLLFVLAYQAMGLLIVAFSANLRLASSAAAFYGGPAFAFTGVTFPTFGYAPSPRRSGERSSRSRTTSSSSWPRRCAARLRSGPARSLAAPSRRSSSSSRPSPLADGTGDARPVVLGADVRTVLRALRDEVLGLFRDPGALLVLVGAIFLYSFFYPDTLPARGPAGGPGRRRRPRPDAALPPARADGRRARAGPGVGAAAEPRRGRGARPRRARPAASSRCPRASSGT